MLKFFVHEQSFKKNEKLNKQFFACLRLCIQNKQFLKRNNDKGKIRIYQFSLLIPSKIGDMMSFLLRPNLRYDREMPLNRGGDIDIFPFILDYPQFQKSFSPKTINF